MLLALRPVFAAESKVVDNPSHGAWDAEPRKNFHLLEELYLGGNDETYDVVFGRIADIAVDSRGRMLILDGGFSRVTIYHPDSMTVRTFGRAGEGPGEFNQPSAIAVDGEDRIYVASQGGRIGIFSAGGEWIDGFRHEFPAGLINDMVVAHDATYLSSYDYVDKKVVHCYDAAHRYTSSFSDSWSVVKPTPPGEIWGQGGAIDVDASGYVYYTQWTPYEIRKFSPEGALMMTIHRENQYKPPRIERQGDSVAYYVFTASVNVFALENGMILNVLVYFPSDTDLKDAKTVLDLFDGNGRLLKTVTKQGQILVRCRDAQGRLYASRQTDVPEVVRYRLQLP